MKNNNANFYLSMLVMFIAGAVAMWAVFRIATTPPTGPKTVVGSESSYSALQQSILKP